MTNPARIAAGTLVVLTATLRAPETEENLLEKPLIPPALIPYLPLIALAAAILICFVVAYRSEDPFTRLIVSTIPILIAAFTTKPRLWVIIGASGTLICLAFLCAMHLVAKHYKGRPAPTPDTVKVLSIIMTGAIALAAIFSVVAMVAQSIWSAGQTWPSTLEGVVRSWLFAIALVTFTPLGMVTLRGTTSLAAALCISALGTLIIVMLITTSIKLAP